MPRLKDFNVGDTVTLAGAAIEKSAALFIGEVTSNGYFLLWKNKESMDAGKPWLHMVSGDHRTQ